MPDCGRGKVTLQDGWLNIAYFRQEQLQLGKYKAPVDLERLQSDPYIEFIQRSDFQNLAPNRDIGAEIQGSVFDSRMPLIFTPIAVPSNSRICARF
jgi:phosphate-selective porin OprO/OprP